MKDHAQTSQVASPRRIRRSGALMAGPASHLGTTVSLDEARVELELREPDAPAIAPSPGTRVSLQLAAFDGEPSATLAADVVSAEWRPRAGTPRTLALTLEVVDDAGRAMLRRLVHEFREGVLVVEESAEDAKALEALLARELRVVTVTRASDAVNALRDGDFAAVVAAERIGAVHVIDFFQKVTELLPESRTLRLVASDFTLSDSVYELVNEGKIFSFIRKPFRERDVVTALRRAVDAYRLAMENERLTRALGEANARLARENTHYQQQLGGLVGFEGLIGQSRSLRAAVTEAARVQQAASTPVHLCGETGTGKELFARAIHAGSPRAGRPFVAHNCGGMSESLLQSTLFGHRKGAFTGADRDQVGLFQRADGGTLFLDEVAELSPLIQSSLLRVLQDGEVLPVGSTRAERVDVRVISATHQRLQQQVREGRFREDLFFRLVVITLDLPPLRERVGDVALLTRHFLEVRAALHGRPVPTLAPETLEALERYRWPGNVRELENVMERLVVLSGDRPIAPDLLPAELRRGAAPADGETIAVPASLGLDDAVGHLKRELIDRALHRTGGTISNAAKALGVERTRLAKLRRRLGGD